MKKDSIIASVISAILIFTGMWLFIWIFPFIYIWANLSSPFIEEKIELQQKAVECSVFKTQKIYTINYAMPSLVLTKDFYTTIEYFNELETLGAAEPWNTKLAIFAYINTGDYDKALDYAIKTDDKLNQIKIYIHKKEFDKAKSITDNLLAEGSTNISLYVYKSKILINENNYADAEKYVDKALNMGPKNVDALYVKAKILNKIGKINEANKFLKKAKVEELKREMMYNR